MTKETISAAGTREIDAFVFDDLETRYGRIELFRMPAIGVLVELNRVLAIIKKYHAYIDRLQNENNALMEKKGLHIFGFTTSEEAYKKNEIRMAQIVDEVNMYGKHIDELTQYSVVLRDRLHRSKLLAIILGD